MTIILFRSPKGGVGTSFLAARTAIALAAHGYEVAAIDCTAQGGLKLFFGLSPSSSLTRFGHADAPAVVVSGVRLFDASASVGDAGFGEALLRSTDLPDLVLLDLPAGDDALRARLLPLAALEICPLAPDPVSLAAMTCVDPRAPLLGLDRTVIVLNQVDDRHRLPNDIHGLFRALLGDQLIGTVRRDEAVNDSLAVMKPLSSFAPASAALVDLEHLAVRIEERCLRAAVAGAVA